MKKSFILLFCTATLTGCLMVSDVVQIGDNLYTASATGDGYRVASDVRNQLLKTASNKCKSLDKNLSLVSEDTRRTRMGIDTTITIDFRCID